MGKDFLPYTEINSLAQRGTANRLNYTNLQAMAQNSRLERCLLLH